MLVRIACRTTNAHLLPRPLPRVQARVRDPNILLTAFPDWVGISGGVAPEAMSAEGLVQSLEFLGASKEGKITVTDGVVTAFARR